MKTGRFALEVFLAAPPSRVHALLGDLRNYGAFHPLLREITELPREPAAPDTQRCEMRERLSFGPFAWTSRYTATMRVVSETELVGGATAPAGVRTRNRFSLHPEGAGTRVMEQVEIDAPGLLLGYALRTAEAAHREQFARMASSLKAPK